MRALTRRFLCPSVSVCGAGSQHRHAATAAAIDEGEGSGRSRVISDADSVIEVRAWVDGVELERTAEQQLLSLARMRDGIIRDPIAVMPDVHSGIGSTVGTVIPTTGALIPASVGVDIGCGMIAARTSLRPEDLPGSLEGLRLAIEMAVPHGRTHCGRPQADAGGWCGAIPDRVAEVWKSELAGGFEEICKRERRIESGNNINHLGTLGSGNHFVELCLDDDAADQRVWVMLHSGSRGVGNRIGSIYIDKAKKDMGSLIHSLPNQDLAYLREGTAHFDDYVAALEWAQTYALWNRRLMLEAVVAAMRRVLARPFDVDAQAINCHHNYVERQVIDLAAGTCYGSEQQQQLSDSNHHNRAHAGKQIWLTRKGASAAYKDQLAVIPGSMGAKSYIVRGKGNAASYCSCSHGAGRRFSRGETRRRFTLQDHEAATAGVACRKDVGVLDETPAAYKDLDAVMAAQRNLVEIVCTLKQVLCVKG